MKIGFLGAGHMGFSIIQGLLNSKKYLQENFKIVVNSQNSLENYQKKNFQVSQDWKFLMDCDLIILALRPNDIKSLQKKLTTTFNDSKIIISIAAGVSLADLKKIFIGSEVTRAMPNTSCQFNQSMTMLTKEGDIQANKIAQEIFNLVGQTIFLKENQIHLFIAICGSASAYLYYWLQPLVTLAVDEGLSVEESKEIVANLLFGVGTNIAHSTKNLTELQQEVSVPQGTTIEAIKVFDQSNLKEIILNAIKAVKKRSQDLE